MTLSPQTAQALLEAAKHCLREHGGFTIKGATERMLRSAIASAEREIQEGKNENQH